MDTIELTRILSSDPYARHCFAGVRASDHLTSKKMPKAPSCLIVNTDPCWKPGTHWLAIFMDENRNLEFFDSYGQHPLKYRRVYEFLRWHGKDENEWKTNTKQLQGPLSSTCGQFCLYFLLWRCRGVSFEKIMSGFDENGSANDIMVTSFINSLVKQTTKVYDVDYVVNQCCKTFFPLTNVF